MEDERELIYVIKIIILKIFGVLFGRKKRLGKIKLKFKIFSRFFYMKKINYIVCYLVYLGFIC